LGPLALPVAAFLLYALTSPGLARGDAVGVYLTAGALVERARPAIDGAIAALAPVAPGADAGPAAYGPLAYAAGHYYHTAPPGPAAYGPLAYAAGHYYHTAPPGPALVAAPGYALGLALAPLLGPDAPALFVLLLGPLLGALAVAGLPRLPRPGSLREGDHLLL